jgi:hypothetical protein
MTRNVVLCVRTIYKQIKTNVIIPEANVAFYEHRPDTKLFTIHTKCGEQFPVQTDDKRLKQFLNQLKPQIVEL